MVYRIYPLFAGQITAVHASGVQSAPTERALLHLMISRRTVVVSITPVLEFPIALRVFGGCDPPWTISTSSTWELRNHLADEAAARISHSSGY